MSKGNGFSSMTPDAAKDKYKRDEANQGDPMSGVLRHKQKQESNNRIMKKDRT
ncbi:hypothetical protein EDC18_102295 [Natranaerovirga pectinivora]|uniref:Uncharacterized protein n=1 Tax=Natranaerovirga pectinivora TaxID=682400 RepID=A0A4R3MS73_9FIRM|nr:hypothetical protein [Natranaerovirga pectinivora]TCT16278.1 hypothetical protein EDC18_102295 [Natranaerovirga pectinivora]